MRMTYHKLDIVKLVVACAEQYEVELSQKNLLFLCMDKYKHISSTEVSFSKRNYLHMTGLKLREWNMHGEDVAETAESFYNMCLSHRLSPEHFEVREDGFTQLKLSVLPYVICKNLKATSLGNFNGMSPELYTEKMADGQRACMGFIADGNTGELVPNALLGGDIRKFIKSPKRIIATFRKAKEDSTYQEITHLAKKIDWKSIAFPDLYTDLRHLIISAVGT